MSEIIDIVNSEDKVLSQGTRTEMMTQGQFGRIATVVIMNKEGNIFLQWRSHKKEVGPRLFDVSCTGHVKAGETYEQAAVRELKEELGITVEEDDLFVLDKHLNEVISMHTTCFILEHNGPFKGWEEEADHADWFEPYEAAFLANRLEFACTLMLERLPEAMLKLEEEGA